MKRHFQWLLLAVVSGCAGDRDPPTPEPTPMSSVESRSQGSARAVQVQAQLQARPQIKVDSSSDLTGLSANGQRALQVAKAHLEQRISQDYEAEFSVTEKPDGYMVFLQYIVGRDENGSPLSYVGGHSMVVVSPDFKVVRVVGGA